MELGAFRTAFGSVTYRQRSTECIYCSLFNCFSAMGRNVNKSRIYELHIFLQFILSVNIF